MTISKAQSHNVIRKTSVLAALVASILVAMTALAGVARAEVLRPALTGSDPESPGISTTPRILGHAGQVGTSVLGGRAASAVRSGTDPSSTVRIYTEAECSGEVLTTGTVAELEGEGIEVSVAAGSTTTFYANLSEPSAPEVVSACSSTGLTYRQVSAPPQAPIVAGVSPESGANFNSPSVFGSADPEATVSVFESADCSGPALGTGTGSQFSSGGIKVSVFDNTTTTFYAEASWAGFGSGCSTTSVTYQEVTPAEQPVTTDPGPGPEPAPEGGVAPPPPSPPAPVQNLPGKLSPPKLSTTPEGTASDGTPLVTGKAPGAADVEIYGSAGCDGPPLASGPASTFVEHGFPVQVAEGAVSTFYGVSIDSAGVRSSCSPEPAVYTRDSSSPHAKITSGPSLKTRKRSVVFRFADIGEEGGTSFICKVDRHPWRPCSAPFRITGLSFRRHVLQVKAVDAAGNPEQTGATRPFQVVR